MEHYDVVVVGAGPAGLAAGATAAGAGVSTLMLDAHQPGGRHCLNEVVCYQGVHRWNARYVEAPPAQAHTSPNLLPVVRPGKHGLTVAGSFVWNGTVSLSPSRAEPAIMG